MRSFEQVIQYWRSEGLTIPSGVPEEALRLFETKYGVTLSEDFREYLSNVNGMAQKGGQDSDTNGFSFWPLNRIKIVPEECADSNVRTPELRDIGSFFVFADYLQWSWAYAIDLGGVRKGRILQFGTQVPRIVAASFTEFVDAYVRDSETLYVPETGNQKEERVILYLPTVA
jgi:hypothetical protein